MKSFKMYLFSFLIVFIFTNVSLSQNSWEGQRNLQLNMNTWFTSPSGNKDFVYDMTYDNYGLNVVGLNANLSTGNHTVQYSLIGNNGEVIQNISLETGQHINGVSIGSYKGKVYVVVKRMGTGSRTNFKIYEKINNGINSFSLKFSGETPNYVYTAYPNAFSSSTMKMCFLTNSSGIDYAYITFDGTAYNLPPNYSIGLIGLIRYNLNNGTSLEELSPVDDNRISPTYPGGSYPNMISENNKLYIIYSKGSGTSSSDPYFVTRMFDGSSYEAPKPVYDFGTPGSGFGQYFKYNTTRASLAAGKDPLIPNQTNLYISACLTYDAGNGYTDVKFKIKELNASAWPTTFNTNDYMILDNLCIFKNPGIIFDNNTSKAGFLYSRRVSSSNPLGRFNDHKVGIGTGTVQTVVTAGPMDQLYAGSINKGIHGDIILFPNSQGSTEFTMNRRLDELTGNITYNTLLTGQEYINKQGLPFAHSNGANIVIRNGSYTTVNENSDFYIDAGGSLTMESGSTLELQSNCNLIVDGSSSYFNMMSGANIKLGANSKIIIRNKGKITAQNITFNTQSDPVWQGIEVTNAAAGCVINGCTFNNAINPLLYTNTVNPANFSRTITNNIFNLPSQGTHCVKIDKCFSAMIDHNTFNCANAGQIGLYINNSPISNTEGAGEPEIDTDPEVIYNFNITNNTFNGGNYSIVALNSSAIIPYYIYGNIFNVTSQSNYGIITRLNNDDIKNNRFNNVSTQNAGVFVQSNIKLFNNDLKSTQATIVGSINSTINAYTNTTTEANTIWISGLNKFYSANNSNVLLSNSDLNVNYGNNCFNKGTGEFHIYGTPLNAQSTYYCKRNNWNTSTPSIFLSGTTNINYYPTIICAETFDYESYDLVDKGYDVIDTTYYSADLYSETLTDDEIAYVQAYEFSINGQFVDAVNSYKELITDFPSSAFINTAVYELFNCSQALDTARNNQDYKDALYSTLKTYLLDRISTGVYGEEFDYNAYNITLICDASINKYHDALDGYSFIALYHPDPEARVQASWDATTIEALLNQGGGESENANVSFSKRLRRIEEISNTDPIQRKLKASYQEKMQNQYAEKEKISKSDTRYDEKVKNISMSKLEDKIYTGVKKDAIDRSKKVLISAKTWSKEQRDQEQIKDIIKYSTSEEKGRKGNSEIVTNYSLSQNYPNPFNPVTNIKYSLPKSGFVSIKIFDVTGKMIKELVSEMKETGNYSVAFDGSQFSSGVYFYRIESNNFVDTKRMVLIK